MSNVFPGGIPYRLDVNRLKDAFPVDSLTEGRLIRHEELEAVINAKKQTQRYYGVINSWCREMKNNNGICSKWVPSEGIRILDPAGQQEFWESGVRQKIKQTNRKIREGAWVDRNRLDRIGQDRYDHMMRATNALKDHLAASRKEMAVDLAPIKSLPKPSIVRDKRERAQKEGTSHEAPFLGGSSGAGTTPYPRRS